MRVLRTSLAGTVILALLGGLGGAVLAQEETAPAGLPTGPAEFTITDDDGTNIVATDPRMSGTAIEGDGVWLEVPTGHEVMSVPGRIENEAGAWECLSSEYQHWTGNPWYLQSWCVGEGAYEGLSAIMFRTLDTGPDGAVWETDPHGIIFEGDPPLKVEAHTTE
jgi:hypothetical protein